MTGHNRLSASSLLLVVLMALSVAFSAVLWFGMDGPMIASRPALKVQVKDQPDPVQLLLPRQMVAHLGRDVDALLLPGDRRYTDAWNAAHRILSHVETADDAALSAEELEALRSDPGLELTFDAAVPLSEWLWAWRGYAGPQEWPPTRHILITLGPSPQVLLQADGETRWAMAPLRAGDSGLNAVLQAIGAEQHHPAVLLPPRVGGFDVAPGLYVPASGYPVSAAHVIPDPLKPDVLARSLFADMAVVRRIAERDGADIYTDGARWLRVYATGQSEYSAAPDADDTAAPTLSEALDRTLEFVSTHGGWLVGSSLVDERVDGDAYHLGFALRFNGLPLVQSRPPLQVAVTRQGVLAYSRALTPPQGPPNPPLPAISATSALESLSSGRRGRSGRVVDMYLGYVRGEEALLRPAWIIVTATGQTLAVSAVSGEEVTVP